MIIAMALSLIFAVAVGIIDAMWRAAAWLRRPAALPRMRTVRR